MKYKCNHIHKFLGFKGVAFMVATIALWQGKLEGIHWVGLSLGICGMRIYRDVMYTNGNGNGSGNGNIVKKDSS